MLLETMPATTPSLATGGGSRIARSGSSSLGQPTPSRSSCHEKKRTSASNDRRARAEQGPGQSARVGAPAQRAGDSDRQRCRKAGISAATACALWSRSRRSSTTTRCVCIVFGPSITHRGRARRRKHRVPVDVQHSAGQSEMRLRGIVAVPLDCNNAPMGTVAAIVTAGTRRLVLTAGHVAKAEGLGCRCAVVRSERQPACT